MTTGSLTKVESIAECSLWSILQYFRPELSDDWYWKQFWPFESGCFPQVFLCYLKRQRFCTYQNTLTIALNSQEYLIMYPRHTFNHTVYKVLVYRFVKLAQEKWPSRHGNSVDWDVKPQTKQNRVLVCLFFVLFFVVVVFLLLFLFVCCCFFLIFVFLWGDLDFKANIQCIYFLISP